MRIASLLLLAALAATSGCDNEGRVRPPQTTLRFFHASPNFGTFALLRERQPEAILEFGASTILRFDSGSYDFTLQSSPPTVVPITHETFADDLSEGMQYTYVAVAPGDQPQLLVSEVPNLPQGFANARYSVIDAHPTQGAMDVYLVAAGTPLNSVPPNGSVSFGPTPATFDVAPQSRRLYLTPAGDPDTVLFESNDLEVEAGSDHYFVVHATGGQTPVDFAVSEVGDAGQRLRQSGAGAMLRVVQGVDDRLARDVILDTETSTPLFSAQPFGELSAYVPVTSAPHKLTLTPAGVPGTEEATIEFIPLPDRFYTAFFAGNITDGVDASVMLEDARPIAGQASVYVINAAGLYDLLLMYILPPGSDISAFFPLVALPPPAYTTSRLALVPADYEITVQVDETEAVVAGPDVMTFAERGVYGILMLNAADHLTVDLRHIYDVPP